MATGRRGNIKKNKNKKCLLEGCSTQLLEDRASTAPDSLFNLQPQLFSKMVQPVLDDL